MGSDSVIQLDELRRRADRRLRSQPQSAPARALRKTFRPGELAELVHELELQRVELEMQNDDLQTAQQALLEARDHFARMFELAPVGYVCLDREAVVREVNAAAATLMGAPQTRLLGRAMSSFLAPDCHATFLEHRLAALQSGAIERCELTLQPCADRQVAVIAMSLAGPHLREEIDGHRMVLVEKNGTAFVADCIRAKDALLEQREAELEQHRLAVHALAEQLVYERNRVRQTVRANVEQVLMPILLRLRESARWDDCAALDALERGLSALGSGFANKLSGGGFGLTSRELEVCHMLRDGLSSKEIAQAISISPQSVDVHRRNIRKKLGLTHQTQSLREKLREIDVDSDTQGG